MASYPAHRHIHRIFSEPPVKIFAGANAKTYYVHPGVLALHSSSALNARMSKPWNNGGENRPIDWTDFDEQTVECVLSYLYTQDYYVLPQVNSEDALPSEQADINHHEGASTPPDSKPDMSCVPEYNEPVLERPLTPLSRCLKAGLPAEITETAAASSCKASQDFSGDMGAAILIHAKVYSFAHRFLLPSLEELALQRLTQILILLDDSETQSLFPSLVDAIHLIYDATPSGKIQDNPARKLLSQFVALKFTALSGEKLDMLMAEGGEFAVDVTRKLARRLTAGSDCTHYLASEIDELRTTIERLKISNQEMISKLKELRER